MNECFFRLFFKQLRIEFYGIVKKNCDVKIPDRTIKNINSVIPNTYIYVLYICIQEYFIRNIKSANRVLSLKLLPK